MGTHTMTIPELASVMGISPSHAYALAAVKGGLPVSVLRVGRRMVVPVREVEAVFGPLSRPVQHPADSL